jgi:hypothetical protein
MTRTDLVDGLRALTDKQFVELFYEAVRGRHIYSEERNIFDAHLVLANAVRYIEEGAHGRWTVEPICPTPSQEWEDDALICNTNSRNSHCARAGHLVIAATAGRVASERSLRLAASNSESV